MGINCRTNELQNMTYVLIPINFGHKANLPVKHVSKISKLQANTRLFNLAHGRPGEFGESCKIRSTRARNVLSKQSNDLEITCGTLEVAVPNSIPHLFEYFIQILLDSLSKRPQCSEHIFGRADDNAINFVEYQCGQDPSPSTTVLASLCNFYQVFFQQVRIAARSACKILNMRKILSDRAVIAHAPWYGQTNHCWSLAPTSRDEPELVSSHLKQFPPQILQWEHQCATFPVN